VTAGRADRKHTTAGEAAGAGPAFSRPFLPREAPFWLSVILAVLSVPYALVVRTRNFLYDMKLLPQRKLPVPAVCLGNLTAGGTGKTPAVAWVARHYLERGISTAVLRRGYKRGRGAGPSDETMLLNAQLSGSVDVIENPDRVAAAREAADRGAAVLVLDDGFQHRRARRDLDIVLVDAGDPFGGEHLLPWGLLREPVNCLSRAGLIILTRSDQIAPANRDALVARLRAIHTEARIVLAAHAPRRLVNASGEEGVDLKRLIGRPVRAFAGIARPEAFFRTLEDLGAHVVERRVFPDHHEYRIAEIERLFSRAGPTWITTEKDWVKIEKLVPPGADLWVLGVELEVVDGREDLEAALNAVAPPP